MPWIKNVSCIKDVVVDAVCGSGLGIVQGLFGISMFTDAEAEEIFNLKSLALSVIQKSPEIVTDPLVCEAIRTGQKAGLDAFSKTASPEAISVGVVIAAELVCTKSFKERFAGVLMGACLNIVGC